MQNFQHNSMPEHGFFRRAFQEFDEQSFFNSLKQRLQEQPYHRKNKGLKNTVLILSYFLNAISALSASYFIYWLTQTLTGLSLLAWVLAGIFLIFLEQLKRKSSNEFFQVYFFQKRTAVGWLLLSLLCLGLSVGSTYFGTEKGAINFAPVATSLLADANEQEMEEEIKRLERENKELKAQKNTAGITFFPAQSAIQSNKKIIVSLRKRLHQKQDQRAQDDRIEKNNHKEKIKVSATTLAWILVFLELVFEACIAYIWYYYYRSYVEWESINHGAKPGVSRVKTSPLLIPPSSEDLIATLQNLQQQILDLKNKKTSPPPSAILSNEALQNTPKVNFKEKNAINRFRGTKSTEVTPYPDAEEKRPVQACTELYNENESTYTVQHDYQRGGKTITVHYTLQQVKARLQQWQRDLTQAQQEQLSPTVIENRQNWVKYWQEKLLELETKKNKLPSSQKNDQYP